MPSRDSDAGPPASPPDSTPAFPPEWTLVSRDAESAANLAACVAYVERRLAPIIGENGSGARLATPRHGEKSRVFLAAFGSRRRVVLRAFGKKAKFRRYAAAMRFCADKDLPLPRMLACDGGAWTRLRYGAWMCAEEFVEGTLLIESERTPAQLEAAVRAVAALHNETSDNWGDLSRLEKSGYRDWFGRHVRRILAELEGLSEALRPPHLAQWRKWFGDAVAGMGEPGRFCLVHNHLAPDDILVAPGDPPRAVILDNGSLQFGSFVQDLEDMLSFLARDAAERREWLGVYMRHQTHLRESGRASESGTPSGTEARSADRSRFLADDYEERFALDRAAYHLQRLRRALRNARGAGDAATPAIARHCEALDALTGTPR